MKTLHVPFHFYPDAVGGTEVYAHSLVQRLQRMGHGAEVAAPGAYRESYVHEGVKVHRFTPGPIEDLAMLYGAGDEPAAEQFDEILDQSAPELVHLHGISPAISIRLLSRLKRRGLPVVLTVHIPGILCARGTLLEHGTEVCDGAIATRRCSRCALEARGLPGPIAIIASNFPAGIGRAVSYIQPQPRWATVVRMTELQEVRQAMLHRFLEEVDQIVAVSEWLRQALLRNGVSEDKLMLCRHGVTQAEVACEQPFPPMEKRQVKRVAYLGRVNEAKGVHVLVDAVLGDPNLPLLLDVYGIVQDERNGYAERLRIKARDDARIQFREPLANEQVLPTLRGYDALAIPSVWLETGPLTVYDAFAAGIPVVGSHRGGIAELVSDERNGILVEPGVATAWTAALRRVCYEAGLLERLRRGITEPRTMDAVAIEMVELYGRMLGARADDVLVGTKGQS